MYLSVFDELKVTRIEHILKTSEDLPKESIEKNKSALLTNAKVIEDSHKKPKESLHESHITPELTTDKRKQSEKINKKKSFICIIL